MRQPQMGPAWQSRCTRPPSLCSRTANGATLWCRLGMSPGGCQASGSDCTHMLLLSGDLLQGHTRQQTAPACRYVKGDFRFRKGYSKSNPRKMVKLWAEKEMRNLIRLSEAGIRCPTAHQLQMHVLVMGFIGSGDVAAPRLKDADLPLVRCTAAGRAVAAPARASNCCSASHECALFELRHQTSWSCADACSRGSAARTARCC